MAFVPNFVGIVIGTAMLVTCHIWLPKIRERRVFAIALPLSLIALTFLSPGQEGVHRWIAIGPFHLNVLMMLAPLVIFVFSELIARNVFGAFCFAASVIAICDLQPDFSQSMSLTLGMVVIILLTTSQTLLNRILLTIPLVVGVFVSWCRPDSLAPVEHVERIIHLMSAHGVVGRTTAALSIVLLFMPLAAIIANAIIAKGERIERKRRDLAMSFLVYFGASFLSTELGNFPVPVLGAGISAVIGWYLMLSLVVGQREMRRVPIE